MPAAISARAASGAQRRVPSTKSSRTTRAPYSVPVKALPRRDPMDWPQLLEVQERSPRPLSTWSNDTVASDADDSPYLYRERDVGSPVPHLRERDGGDLVQEPIGSERSAAKDYSHVRPLAQWVVEFMVQLVETDVLPLDTRSSSCGKFDHYEAVDRISLIFLTMTMPPGCIFYALYYSEKILRAARENKSVGTLYAGALYNDGPLATEELIVRAFVVGLMLADKYLNCATFHTKTWSNHAYISISILNQMEMHGLRLLDYKLRIQDDEWWYWLEHIAHCHSLFDLSDRAHASVARTIKVLIATARSPSLDEPEPKVMKKLPSPVEWNPAADAVVSKVELPAGCRKPEMPGAKAWDTFPYHVISQDYPVTRSVPHQLSVVPRALAQERPPTDVISRFKAWAQHKRSQSVTDAQPMAKAYPTAAKVGLGRPSRYL